MKSNHVFSMTIAALLTILAVKMCGEDVSLVRVHFIESVEPSVSVFAEGDESEIDIGPKGAMKREFDAWQWVPLAEVPHLAIDFRRPVYEEVVQEFARFARRHTVTKIAAD
jgi:hypothetical protein